jgi:hypothetical protein
MPKHITYMKVTHHSKGADPIEVTKVMKELGWEPVCGDSDFAYEWKRDMFEESAFREYCNNIIDVHNRLKELDVSYSLNTSEQGKENSKKINCV